MSSSSSASDSSDPSRVAAERVESEDAEASAAEAVSGSDDFAVDISSVDKSVALSTSSWEEGMVAGTSAEEDEVSMDELRAAEAAFDSDSTAFASKPKSAEGAETGAVEEHETIGVVTSAERVVETTPITITSSGGTVQDDPSGSGSRAECSLLDSSPLTRHYVRRARRGSIVSTDSEMTVSATVRVPTPSSPLHESSGTAPTPVVVTTVVPAEVTIQESGTAPAVVEEVPGNEEVPAHIPEIPEGNIFC